MATKKNGRILPSMADIEEALWSQVLGLRTGKVTPVTANAVSNTIGKMFTGMKVQMDFSRMTGETPNIPMLQHKNTVSSKEVAEEQITEA